MTPIGKELDGDKILRAAKELYGKSSVEMASESRLIPLRCSQVHILSMSREKLFKPVAKNGTGSGARWTCEVWKAIYR